MLQCKVRSPLPPFQLVDLCPVCVCVCIGSGSTAIFTSDLFEKRMELVKLYLKSDEQGLEVLYALQVAVAKLSHPPSNEIQKEA